MFLFTRQVVLIFIDVGKIRASSRMIICILFINFLVELLVERLVF